MRAMAKPQTSSNDLHREGRGMHASRDPKHVRQAGYRRSGKQPPGLSLPDVSGSKGWQAKTCNKPKTVNPVSEDRALQDGRHPHAERPAKSRRLDGQDRPERCLFHDPHGSRRQRISPVPVEEQNVSVQLPASTTESLLRDHITARVYLLEILGFVTPSRSQPQPRK